MTINGTRWTIGWSPKQVIVGFLIGGVVVGAMAEAVGAFAFVGLLAGVGTWLWGRSEVNSKYLSLLEDFRDGSRRQIERETGGMEVSSAHTFVSASGDSPALIEPARTYRTAHLLFGDTSIVVNRQYEFDMKERTQRKGGKQQEVFYDQISNVQSEDYKNYAELQISLSSGDTEHIRGRDTAGIDEVKSDLQQKMRDARRAARRPQEPSAPAATRTPAGGAAGARGAAPASESAAPGGGASGTPTASDGASDGTARAGDETGRAAPGTDAGSAVAEADDGAVSTDWLAETPDDPTLAVRNDGVDAESVRVGCRADGEEELADDVRLAPGETAEWESFTEAIRFEVAVIVRDGPTAGKRFDLREEDSAEIQVSVTDADVAFGDVEPSPTPPTGDGSTAASSRAPDSAPDGEDDRTVADADTAQADAGSATSDAGSTTDDDASGGSSSSSIADKVFGESGGESATDAGTDESDGDDATDEPESWDSAAELSAAVRESASRDRVVRLTEFLDAPAADERLAAAAGLRESVSAYPDPVARSVSDLAALLDEDDQELREAAMGTLRGLAKNRPDAAAAATDACVDRLDDESPKIRTAACRVLEAVEATEATGALDRLADEDEHKGVQVAAFQAVQSLDG
ncbi:MULTISPECIES: HEAT repeat domain-containing protein [Halorussus]|uniref:HEAT repeat domain-containing protein n=1 Tax=Halorussus TaxID=1070314 RepID=UPI000E219D2A|nr:MULTISPECIES: HEAT repeat domain-containing protein [Halorussus]NHN61082.1 HEAT repeat domain-containing protein [Halorussus sp. JP-T4]